MKRSDDEAIKTKAENDMKGKMKEGRDENVEVEERMNERYKEKY